MSVKNLPSLVRSSARRFGPKPAVVSMREGVLAEFGWIDLKDAAWSVARRLVDAGVAPEEPVAILQDGSPEALAAEIGAQAAAAVACLLDARLPADVLAARIRLCGATRLLIPPGLGEAAEAAARAAEGLQAPLALDRMASGATAVPPAADDQDDPVVEERLARVGPETPSTALFTRGTVRTARAVAWPQAALLANAGVLAATLQATDDDAWLALGPATHPFLRLVGVYAALASGGTVCLPPRDEDVMGMFWLARPSFVACPAEDLPALAERVRAELDGVPGFQGRIARWAVDVGARASRTPPAGWAGRLRASIAETVVQNRATEVVGGRLRAVIAGWAPVGPEPAALLAGLGAPVRGAWGCTEAGAVTTIDGRPLEGTVVRAAPDGELQVRGPGAMFSYVGLSPKINVDLQDGWVRTGDRGSVGADGTVDVLGRMEHQHDSPVARLKEGTGPDGL